MKKKVALLLALIMVLSMLPMNVFGDAVQVGIIPARPGVVGAGLYQRQAAAQTVPLQFDIGALSTGATSEVALRVTLHAGDDSYFNVTAYVPAAGGNPAVPATVIPVALGHGVPTASRLHTWFNTELPAGALNMVVVDVAENGRWMLLEFANNLPIPHDVAGMVHIQIPTVVNYNNTRLSARMDYANPAVEIFSMGETRLDRAPTAGDLGISSGDARDFATEVVALPNVILTENQFGNFGRSVVGWDRQGSAYTVAPGFSYTADTGTTLVRLEAPTGYIWELGTGFAPTIYLAARQDRWGNQANPTPTWWRVTEMVNNVRHDVLYMHIPTLSTWTTGAVALPRTLQIRNLHLVATGERLGAVNIHVATIHQVPHGSVTPPAQEVRVTRPGSVNRLWQSSTEHVATRVGQGLGYSVLYYGDDFPTIRTGYTAPNNVSAMGATTNAPIQNVNIGSRGIQTATVRIYENAPGAWGSIVGDHLDFTFDQEGVTIVGAAARLGWNYNAAQAENPRNIFPGTGNNPNATAAGTSNIHSWEGSFLPWGATTIEAASVNTGNTRLTPNVFRATVRPIPPGTLSAADVLNRRLRHTRVLEVTFWVSVTGGFEARNPGETIDVTVRGAGAANLNGTVIPVAIPVDPISLALPDGPVDLVTDVLSTVSNHQISDIEVTIYEPHLMGEGTSFYFAIGGVEASDRAFGLHLFASSVSVSGEGFVVGQPTRQPAAGATATAGSGFFLPIHRVPDEGVNSGPITITLSNVSVSGTVIPHVQYNVIVLGTAVADNFHDSNTALPLVGRFAIEPYYAFAGAYYHGIIGDAPPSGDPGELPPLPQVFRLQEGVPFRGVDQPLIWETVGNYRVGMVSLRAFAYLIGIEADDIDWNPETQTAVIRGQSSQGVAAGVQVTQGVSMARVFEAGAWVDHDIASFAHGQGHVLSNNVSAVNRYNRLYVPFRFAANAFGYSVELIGYNLVEFR